MPGTNHPIIDLLVPTITGFFTLAALLLNDYLKNRGEGPPSRKSAEKRQVEQESAQATPSESSSPPTHTPVVAVRIPQPTPGINRGTLQAKEGVSKTSPGAIFATLINIGTTVGGAFFANWLLDWSARVFHIQLRPPRAYLVCILLAGLIWGFVYIGLAFSFATNWVELLLSPLVGWFGLLDLFDFGDFIRTVLSALPLNIVLALGVAHGGATFAARNLHAEYDGAFYLVFGVVTALELVACITND